MDNRDRGDVFRIPSPTAIRYRRRDSDFDRDVGSIAIWKMHSQWEGGVREAEVARHFNELKVSMWATESYLPGDVCRALVPFKNVSYVQRKWLCTLREHC